MRDADEPFDFASPRMALLRSVAEQLKLPLTVIARQAELASFENVSASTVGIMTAIQTQSDVALRLVDSYLLGLQLAEDQEQLALEPVSVAATLTDVAQDLHALAKLYDVDVEVHIDGKYVPVMAHARGFRAALLSLGYELIEAQAAAAEVKERLSFVAHRTPHGVVAGLYGDFPTLRAEAWRKSLELCGRARQAAPSLTAGSGAGLFVAETLFSAMDTRVRVGRFHKRIGLAATLQPSRQLQLV